MFPSISKDNLVSNEAFKSLTNASTDYDGYKITHSEKIWKQDQPPENIEIVYKWFRAKQKLVQTKLDQLDAYYKIDEQNRFKTLTKYSTHLNRIKSFIGISELKSAKTMHQVHQLIKFNQMRYKLAELKEAQKNLEAPHNEIISIDNKPKQLKLPPIVPKSASTDKKNENTTDENQLLKNMPVVLPVAEDVKKEEINEETVLTEIDDDRLVDGNQIDSQNLKLVENKQESREDAEERIRMIKSDPVITPILDAIRRNLIKIGPQEEIDAEVLKEVLDTTLEAVHEKYPPLIEQVEELCEIFERYFLSFLITDDKNFFIK